MQLTDETRAVVLIALHQALQREDSITARIRIQGTISELEDLAPTPGKWTVDTLFGGPVERIAPEWYVCTECGACVRHSYTHTAWHNEMERK